MPGTFEFGEVSYTLTDVIVASYNDVTNTYGTPAALASGHTVSIEPEGDNDKLMGYGVTTGMLSVVRGATLGFGAGGIDFSVMAIVAGLSTSTSGTGAQRVRKVLYPAGGEGLPYFGMIGVAATTNSGYAAVGLQCCKLDSHPKWTLDGKENKFNVSEVGGYAMPIQISSVYYLIVAKEIEDKTTWNAPATGGAFLTFFTG
jgi:hypothetical protein